MIFTTRVCLVTYNAMFTLEGQFLKIEQNEGVGVKVILVLLKNTSSRLHHSISFLSLVFMALVEIH